MKCTYNVTDAMKNVVPESQLVGLMEMIEINTIFGMSSKLQCPTVIVNV